MVFGFRSNKVIVNTTKYVKHPFIALTFGSFLYCLTLCISLTFLCVLLQQKRQHDQSVGEIADLESLLSSVLPLSSVRSGAETLELVAYLIFYWLV